MLWLLTLWACGSPPEAPAASTPTPMTIEEARAERKPQGARRAGTLTLQSDAFGPGGPIPERFTCEGEDISPALSWSGVPETAKSLALIVEDPDVPDPAKPTRTWVHWVVYDLPASATGLAEGVKTLPEGARDGTNDWKRVGYGGPCPPIGRHRYMHRLYALDTVLGDIGAPTRAELLIKLQPHVVAETKLVGTYVKTKK